MFALPVPTLPVLSDGTAIRGPSDTPYEKGTFKLHINIPDRYPFEPPRVQFATPVYHPNIDTAGRICLSSLQMPPKGTWTPSLNISTVLCGVQSLLAEINADDPLMADINEEYKHARPRFVENARRWTELHATAAATAASTSAATEADASASASSPASDGSSKAPADDEPAAERATRSDSSDEADRCAPSSPKRHRKA
eukprot:TRINITY_DN22400_c0_g1_i1.p2 TRINITY_DN22400_c0_g1~~TRINITY_DN22400_c0_g1_i1.p2  ORF type:complete len:198 (+),score=59.76 TRINITY_DN22400_c0_g1_i1:412-1005(+)